MSFEYIQNYYNVPACYGRRVRFAGNEGIIVRATHYIWVVFDKDKPTLEQPMHPCETGLEYLGMGEPRKLTRSQKRYQKYLRLDIGCTFAEYLGIHK